MPSKAFTRATSTVDLSSYATTSAMSAALAAKADTTAVTSAVNAVIASAPGALNTLDELAAAIGDDAAFSTTVTNALAAKAPLASPSLTGTPTAPTAAGGTNNTQVATTAFVTAAVAPRVGSVTTTYTGGTGAVMSIAGSINASGLLTLTVNRAVDTTGGGN